MTDDLMARVEALESALAGAAARLRVLEDIEAIKQLQIRYVNDLCFGTFEHVLDYFVEDSSYDIGRFDRDGEWQPLRLAGLQQIRELFDRLSKLHVGKEGTFVVHPLIEVDGDTATGSWIMYINYYYPRTGQPLGWVQTVFTPEYVRRDGVWKFQVVRARERIGLPFGAPAEAFLTPEQLLEASRLDGVPI